MAMLNATADSVNILVSSFLYVIFDCQQIHLGPRLFNNMV